MIRKKLITTAIFILVLIVLLYLITSLVVDPKVRSSSDPLPNIKTQRRILVFAPHCDDETLGTGGIIAKAMKNGDKVKVIMMTNGDGFIEAVDVNFNTLRPSPAEYLRFASVRQNETLKALSILGLPSGKVIFLGYPDGGLAYLWGEYFSAKNNFVSHFTQADRVPYSNAYLPKAAYKGEALLGIVEEIINNFKPTDVFFPHPSDRHPDHWATNGFVKLAMGELNIKPREYLYLVHFGEWPKPWALRPRDDLVPPHVLLSSGTQWKQYILSNSLERQKLNALKAYKSQMAVMRSFLVSFVRENELFGIFPDLNLIAQSDVKIFDPAGDTVTTEISGAADITALHFVKKGKGVTFEIIFRDTPVGIFTYGLRLKAIHDNQKIYQSDIQVVGNKLSTKNVQSFIVEKDITLKKILKGYQIHINKTDAQKYFISADSSLGNLNIDKTPLVEIEFP